MPIFNIGTLKGCPLGAIRQNWLLTVTCNLKNMMKDAVMDSWFFDEPSDRSTFGRLQGKKVDDMVNTNL